MKQWCPINVFLSNISPWLSPQFYLELGTEIANMLNHHEKLDCRNNNITMLNLNMEIGNVQNVEDFWAQCLLTRNQPSVSKIRDYIKNISRQVQRHPGHADLNDALGTACFISYLQRLLRFFEMALQRNSPYFMARRRKD